MRDALLPPHRGRVPFLIGMLLLTACSAADEADPSPSALSRADSGIGPSPIVLSSADSGTTVAAAVGQELDVTLQTIGPGKYGTPSLSSDAIRFLDVSYPAQQNPGGPRQLFRFRAVSAGTVDVSMTHTGDNAPFSMTVSVD